MVNLLPDIKVAVSNPKIEPLGPNHDRAAFLCLDKSLTDYMRGDRVWRDALKRAANVFVCVNQDDPKTILGYFTLSQGSIARDTIARSLFGNDWESKSRTRHLVHTEFPYPDIPLTKLGRFAIHKDLGGTGFSNQLLGKALLAALEGARHASARLLYLDAVHEKVVPFYKKAGFERIEPDGLEMFLQMDTIADGK